MKIVAYCDGACQPNPGNGGWGSIVTNGVKTKELKGSEDNTTNNRMELTAVLETIKYYSQHLSEHKLDIYCDSAYVVNAIKKEWLKKWMTNGFKKVDGKDIQNKDLWVEIYSLLKEHKQVNLIKVKGHSGDILNEKVDKIAKEQVNKGEE